MLFGGGAKLADLLELVGIPKCSRITSSGRKHVEFVSIDKCKEENGGPYKASIPLIQATNPESDVLLAYEMNGETLNRDHGYPLRVIVPGVIGARSVKWLDSINIIVEECQGFFMQKDYKMFPPSADWNNISWPTRRPQMDFPVQSAICSLDDVNFVKPGKITVKGYATSGGGCGRKCPTRKCRCHLELEGNTKHFMASCPSPDRPLKPIGELPSSYPRLSSQMPEFLITRTLLNGFDPRSPYQHNCLMLLRYQ